MRHATPHRSKLGTGQARDTIKTSEIIKFFQKVSLEDLEKLKDIGPVVGKSIHGWFREKRNISLLERLEKTGVTIKATSDKRQATSDKFRGMSFVFTGELSSMSRDEAKEKVSALGASVSESVSQKTSYVVVGENPGSKYEKAKKLGIPILDEKEFLIYTKH